MWTCEICGSKIEDDAWEACWHCSSPRELQPGERDAILARFEAKRARVPQCLRCGTAQHFDGTRHFHADAQSLWLLLGDGISREAFDVYHCPKCGKLEFFVDGIGENLRCETPLK